MTSKLSFTYLTENSKETFEVGTIQSLNERRDVEKDSTGNLSPVEFSTRTLIVCEDDIVVKVPKKMLATLLKDGHLTLNGIAGLFGLTIVDVCKMLEDE